MPEPPGLSGRGSPKENDTELIIEEYTHLVETLRFTQGDNSGVPIYYNLI